MEGGSGRAEGEGGEEEEGVSLIAMHEQLGEGHG